MSGGMTGRDSSDREYLQEPWTTAVHELRIRRPDRFLLRRSNRLAEFHDQNSHRVSGPTGEDSDSDHSAAHSTDDDDLDSRPYYARGQPWNPAAHSLRVRHSNRFHLRRSNRLADSFHDQYSHQVSSPSRGLRRHHAIGGEDSDSDKSAVDSTDDDYLESRPYYARGPRYWEVVRDYDSSQGASDAPHGHGSSNSRVTEAQRVNHRYITGAADDDETDVVVTDGEDSDNVHVRIRPARHVGLFSSRRSSAELFDSRRGRGLRSADHDVPSPPRRVIPTRHRADALPGRTVSGDSSSDSVDVLETGSGSSVNRTNDSASVLGL